MQVTWVPPSYRTHTHKHTHLFITPFFQHLSLLPRKHTTTTYHIWPLRNAGQRAFGERGACSLSLKNNHPSQCIRREAWCLRLFLWVLYDYVRPPLLVSCCNSWKAKRLLLHDPGCFPCRSSARPSQAPNTAPQRLPEVVHPTKHTQPCVTAEANQW